MTRPVIQWSGVHKSFGPKTVLAGFDLSVSAGESVAVLGASGVGKSVALRHVIGLVKPDRGQVLVEGRDVSELDDTSMRDVRRRVAMVFQGGALFDSMTVAENVSFGLREHDPAAAASAIAERVAEVLAMVGLSGTEEQVPADLSGGMRKRVALARAVAVGPDAILYDEPTTGLDPVTTSRVNREIRGLQERLGVSSVIVTHDVRSAFEVADRVAYLREGRVVFEGTVAEARDQPPPVLAAFLRGEEYAGPRPT